MWRGGVFFFSLFLSFLFSLFLVFLFYLNSSFMWLGGMVLSLSLLCFLFFFLSLSYYLSICIITSFDSLSLSLDLYVYRLPFRTVSLSMYYFFRPFSKFTYESTESLNGYLIIFQTDPSNPSVSYPT